MNGYTVEFMPNGLISIICHASKLRGCYFHSGIHKHGDLYMEQSFVKQLIEYNRTK